MRVLVVGDHAMLAGRIAQGLSQAGVAVDAVIVAMTMARLRRKLGYPPLTRTVAGKGYRM